MSDLILAEPMPLQTREQRPDEKIIELWLGECMSPKTRAAYAADASQFLVFVGKSLQAVTREDVIAYRDSLAAAGLALSSQSRKLASVKALFKFGHESCRDLFANPARSVKLPRVPTNLAERILSEAEVLQMLAKRSTETQIDRRNRIMVQLLYTSGLRVSELTSLCWRHVKAVGEREGQVTVVGKGGKERAVHLYAGTWAELMSLRCGAAEDAPVFPSRERDAFGNVRRLDNSQVLRIVRGMAKRAGIAAADRVSPHWMRHAHASHSLNRGAPISLVQQTLGHSSVAVTGRYTHAMPTESAGKYLVVR